MIVDEQPASAAPDSMSPKKTRIRPRVRFIALASLCTIFGIGGSLALQKSESAQMDEATEDASAFLADPFAKSEKPIWEAHPYDEPKSPLDRIDRALLSRDFAEGLRQCEAKHNMQEEHDVEWRYRHALALEGAGKCKEASLLYQRIVNAEANAILHPWALLGQARCAASLSELKHATRLCGQAQLQCGPNSGNPIALRTECLYLLARLKVMELVPPERPDPLDAKVLAWPSPNQESELPVERLLPKGVHHGVGSSQEIWIDEPSPSVAESLLSGHMHHASVRSVLESVAGAIDKHLRLEVTLKDETLEMDLERMPFQEVIGAIGANLGLSWRIEKSDLVISAENPPGLVERKRLATLALQQARAVDAEHPDEYIASIWLANLLADDGRWRKAKAEYKRLLEALPNHNSSIHAVYNLALAEFREGYVANARARFTDVLDRQPNSAWADIGWYWVGRTYLEVGDTTAALRPLKIAMSKRSRSVDSAAALALRLCHVLMNDDDEARVTMEKYRISSEPRHGALDEMLANYIRNRTSPTESRSVQLEASLHEASNGEGLGAAGILLAGQAYRELDQHRKMVELYEKAVETSHGPLAYRMTFEVAQYFDIIDARREARKRYLALTAADPDGLGDRAMLALADLAARDGQGELCLSRCHSLLVRKKLDPAEVLHVMARGYELRKQYRQAAEALAGRVPVE